MKEPTEETDAINATGCWPLQLPVAAASCCLVCGSDGLLSGTPQNSNPGWKRKPRLSCDLTSQLASRLLHLFNEGGGGGQGRKDDLQGGQKRSAEKHCEGHIRSALQVGKEAKGLCVHFEFAAGLAGRDEVGPGSLSACQICRGSLD